MTSRETPPHGTLRLVRTDSETPQVTSKKLFGMLTSTIKNCSLYPEGHAMYKKAVLRFWSYLDGYFKARDCFDLRVDPHKGVICDEEVIYKGDPQPGEFLFVLLRDGIARLTIEKEVEPWEILELIRRAVDNLHMDEDAEGDFVTSLWEAQLPHVYYQSIDTIWRDDEEELEELEKVLPASSQNLSDIRKSLRSTSAATPMPASLMELTPAELLRLEETVHDALQREDTEEALDILFETLQGHVTKDDLGPIIQFLSKQFEEGLEKGDYGLASRIFQRMYVFRRHCEENKKDWALPFISEFFRRCSKGETLKNILSSWSEDDPWQQDELSKILKMLPPESMRNLAHLLLKSPSARFEKVIMDALAYMASLDIGTFEAMLKKADEPLTIKLVQVLRKVEGDRPTKVLLGMVRKGSVACRREAIKVLVVRGPWALKELFPLIEDDDEGVWRVVLEGLGRSRNPAAEDLLLGYLQHKKFRASDNEFMMECFLALGKCGSDRSVPFLQRCLLEKSMNPLFHGPRRTAAAMALMALGTNRSKEILNQAANSIFPWVRSAVQRAMEQR
jgi:hypothetical protein